MLIVSHKRKEIMSLVIHHRHSFNNAHWCIDTRHQLFTRHIPLPSAGQVPGDYLESCLGEIEKCRFFAWIFPVFYLTLITSRVSGSTRSVFEGNCRVFEGCLRLYGEFRSVFGGTCSPRNVFQKTCLEGPAAYEVPAMCCANPFDLFLRFLETSFRSEF